MRLSPDPRATRAGRLRQTTWRQQPHKPILVRLFSSNINFKGVYLQQDIITRPSIVSVHTCLFFTILISFHKISWQGRSFFT